MTPQRYEHLSACMDGELDRDELRFLLRRLEHDAELKEVWTRYHLVRGVLRHQPQQLVGAAFAEHLRQSLEPQGAAVLPRRLERWLHWSIGGVIAAGVAALALMSVRPVAAPDAGLQVNVATRAAPATVPAGLIEGSKRPAAVPSWLMSNDAGQYRQIVSATIRSEGYIVPSPRQSWSGWQMQSVQSVMPPWGTDDGDGSYVFLLRTQASSRSGQGGLSVSSHAVPQH